MHSEEHDTGTDAKKTMSRTELMDVTAEIVLETRKKSVAGRFRSPDTEKLRDSKTRLCIQAITAYGVLLRDEQLEDILRRLDALEDGT